MELNAEDRLLAIGAGDHERFASADRNEIFAETIDAVAVRQKNQFVLLHPVEQRRSLHVQFHGELSVFSHRLANDRSASFFVQHLQTVANAQNRQTALEQLRVVKDRIGIVDGTGTSGDDDRLVTASEQFFHGALQRHQLRVNGQLSNSPIDHLGVLRAGIEDGDLIVVVGHI